jgi:hypothetical protein
MASRLKLSAGLRRDLGRHPAASSWCEISAVEGSALREGNARMASRLNLSAGSARRIGPASGRVILV